jgi:hypothetical protein
MEAVLASLVVLTSIVTAVMINLVAGQASLASLALAFGNFGNGNFQILRK